MYVYKYLEKYCSVAKPFRSNYRSLDPIYGFYFDCADFPNQKRNEKRWDVRKKKSRSYWHRSSSRHGLTVAGETEISRLSLFSVQLFAGKTVVAGAAKKKKRELSCSQRKCSDFFTHLCGCPCIFLLMATAPPPFLFSFSLCCTGSSRGECAVLSWTSCRTDARIRKDS